MHGRTIRYTATAVALVAVYAVVHSIGGAGNGASVALGRVRKAIAKAPWIHVQTEVDAPQHKGRIDEWVCFGDQIEIHRGPDGAIRYRDEGRQTMSTYDPAGNTITISSLDDEYAAARRDPFPTSPAAMLDGLMNTLNKTGDAEVSVSAEQRDERAVEVIRVTSQITGETVMHEVITITIDAQSELPITMDASVTREDETVVAKAHAVFDYPQDGPRDLHVLGARQDARVIDRRPDPNAAATAEVRVDFAVDPEVPSRQTLLLSGAVVIDMVKIPPGEFLMGSPDTEIGYPAQFLERFGERIKAKHGTLRPDNEGPQHLVKIARGFYLSTCEITCAQFRKFRPEFRKLPHSVGPLGGKLMRLEMDLDDLPACVGLDDAVAFCNWLGEKTGLMVRLPCEAEWEYACRAGTQTRFFWGDAEEDAGRYANVADKAYAAVDRQSAYVLNTDDGNVGPAPVGHYLPNAFGLRDMIGNATEWTVGVYSGNACSIDPQNKKFDTGAEGDREPHYRGGGWRSDVVRCRCASREEVPQDAPSDTRSSAIGFRILVEEK